MGIFHVFEIVQMVQNHARRLIWKLWYTVGNEPKGWISKRVFQENKARQLFRKTNISYPLIDTCTCARQRLRNVCFSGNLACFVFLKDPFWDSPFWLITDDTGIKYQGSLIENLVKKKNSLKHLYFCVVFYLAIEMWFPNNFS